MIKKLLQLFRPKSTHSSDVTRYPDGRQDVTVRLSKINVDEKTEEGKLAKKKIEEEIIPAMAGRKVLVTVVHIPTGEFTARIVKLANVRAYANSVLHSWAKRNGKKEWEVDPAEFYVIENDGWAGDQEAPDIRVRVTKLL